MEKITKRKQTVLDVLDDQIAELEEKLAKFQPFINELNQLKATRRTLLAQKGNTSGGGHPGTQLTQEEVINFLQKNGASTPQEISEGLSVAGTVVRSHLSRHKNVTYERDDEDGTWSYIGADEEDDE